MSEISRRTFISLCVAAACAAAGGVNAGNGHALPASDVMYRRLIEGLFSSPAHARAVGVRYLALAPSEANAEVLLARLFPNADIQGDLAPLKAAMRQKRQNDFECGDVVVLDGWVLARSEARLCALASVVCV